MIIQKVSAHYCHYCKVNNKRVGKLIVYLRQTHTLDEVSQIIGKSRERVRQIQARHVRRTEKGYYNAKN